MENKEMNTEKVKFYKKYPVLLAWLISIFIDLSDWAMRFLRS